MLGGAGQAELLQYHTRLARPRLLVLVRGWDRLGRELHRLPRLLIRLIDHVDDITHLLNGCA